MDVTPIYTYQKDRIFVALSHGRCNTVIAVGKFPRACPKAIIDGWIRKKSMSGHLCASGSERAYTPASLLSATSA